MREGDFSKKKGREKKCWKKNKQKQANADTRCSYPSPPSPFSSSLASENEREEQSGGPRGPSRSAAALSLTLQSSSFPSIPSILHPSLCPQQSLYSSVFISLPLPPSLAPPSISFHVVTHYSTDISPSVPLPPRQSLPYCCWPSPLCLSLDGTTGKGGGRRSRWTDSELQRRRGEERIQI